MKEKTPLDLEIVELILVRCGTDYNRTYLGTIKRGTDSEGNQLLSGSVVVDEGKIYCSSSTEDHLYKCLDEICLMKVSYRLHFNIGARRKINDLWFHLN